MIEAGFYVQDGKAYLPVFAKTEAGFYLDKEPVEVVAVKDGDAFSAALKRAIGRGNPVVPSPRSDEYGSPIVLKYAKVRSWSRFEKDAAFWMLSLNDDWTFGQWKRASKGWEPDQNALTCVEHGCSMDDFVRRIVASVQQAHT